jgi:hypothetical protein
MGRSGTCQGQSRLMADTISCFLEDVKGGNYMRRIKKDCDRISVSMHPDLRSCVVARTRIF